MYVCVSNLTESINSKHSKNLKALHNITEISKNSKGPHLIKKLLNRILQVPPCVFATQNTNIATKKTKHNSKQMFITFVLVIRNKSKLNCVSKQTKL